MSGNNIVLHAAPLSSGFRMELERKFSTNTDYLALQTLRRLPVLTMVRSLMAIAPRQIIIPVEDASSRTLVPLLLVLAAVTRASRITQVDRELREFNRSRWGALLAIGALLQHSVHGQFALWLSRRATRKLNAARRHPASCPPQLDHLLYLNSGLWFGIRAGGSVGHISGVVNAFLQRGVKVDFSSVGGRLMVRDGATLIDLYTPSMYAIPFEVNAHLFARSVTKQMRDHYKAHQRPQLIYQRLTLGNTSGVELSRHWGVPLVLEYNGSEAWIAANWGRRLRYHNQAVDAEDACLRHAHLVVTISDALRDELVSRGVEPNRIVNYPNCIDPEIFDPGRIKPSDSAHLRAKLSICPNSVVVTFLGTFGQWHGATVFAQVIRKLAQEDRSWIHRQRVHFLFVGDGSKMAEVREILAPVESLGEICTFVGLIPQAEAPAYLGISDIFVSPHVPNADGSAFFGSPTKLFEYLAMGKAIVASNLDQIGQVLSPGLDADSGTPPQGNEVAILTIPGSIDSLEAGIRLAVCDEELCKLLGRNSRALALARYTWARHVDEIMAGIGRIRSVDGPE